MHIVSDVIFVNVAFFSIVIISILFNPRVSSAFIFQDTANFIPHRRQNLQQQRLQGPKHSIPFLVKLSPFNLAYEQQKWMNSMLAPLHLSSSLNDSEEEKVIEGEKNIVTTLDNLAEMIEVSFVKSFPQLARGYVDVAKLFIAAVKGAYECSTPLSTLRDEALPVADKAVCSAGRDLLPEELRLRGDWMEAVYVTLIELKHPNNISVSTTNSGDGGAALTLVEKGAAERVQRLIEHGTTDDDDNNIASGGANDEVLRIRRAIQSQTSKLISLIGIVLEEELECRGSEGDVAANAAGSKKVPGPYIPGGR